jgi:hypothetical protein
MNFKQYFEEANIQRLSPQEEEQALKITNIIWNRHNDFKPENFSKLKRSAIKDGRLELIKVSDLNYERRNLKTALSRNKTLPVYVNISPNGNANAAFMPHKNPKDDYIFIDHSFLNENLSKSMLYALITHEFIHAVQHYRKISQAYQNASNKEVEDMTFEDWIDYYSEPLEKEAIFSEMDALVRNQYKLLVPNPDNRESINKYLDRNREKFLLELSLFATTPLENYILNNELPIPSSLSKFEHFLATLLQRNEKLKKVKLPPHLQKKLEALRREFKIKLLSVYNNLQKQEAQIKGLPSKS